MNIETLNHWNSEGLSPIGVSHRYAQYDGNRSGPLSEPRQFWSHDVTHWRNMGPRDTDLLITPQEYYQMFRARMRARFPTSESQRLLESLWFFTYHEKRGAPYSPASLRRILGDSTSTAAFIRRLRPGDIGDYFPEGYPSRQAVDEARLWLLEFGATAEREFKLTSSNSPRQIPAR